MTLNSIVNMLTSTNSVIITEDGSESYSFITFLELLYHAQIQIFLQYLHELPVV